tara:strand:+ start:390 stop:632 length:243 start_codon:yes stop_codon:yes gene_type:complete
MKIEKGIPLPFGTEPEKYEYLKDMEVGDSVVMTAKQRNNLYSYGRVYGYKFISRATKDGKIRVWLKERRASRVIESSTHN